MAELLFFCEDVKFPSFVTKKSLRTWASLIAKEYKRKLGQLSFILCGDERILAVNREYLGHDYYTDVITFDYYKGDILSGDIFISLDTLQSNAEEFHTSFEDEFYRVFCHSLLHLIGFNDKSDEEILVMRREEERCLKILRSKVLISK